MILTLVPPPKLNPIPLPYTQHSNQVYGCCIHVYCNKTIFDCKDSIDRVYSLNFVCAYVESMPRKRFVSKNEVRNKFIEGYNTLKNAMDIVTCKNRALVFDWLPPLCVQMPSQ